MILFFLVALSTMAAPAMAFTAYDCDHPNATVHVLDLTGPEPCENITRRYLRPRNVSVQVIQTEGEARVMGHRCYATVTRRVTSCGQFDSITYGGRFSAYDEPIDISKESCRLARDDRIFPFDGKLHRVDGLGRLRTTYFTHGWVDGKGKCGHGSFTSHGNYYEGAYEETVLRFAIEPIIGTVDFTRDTVLFDSGLKAMFSKGFVKDTAFGSHVWNATLDSCDRTVSSIYAGVAVLRPDKQSTDNRGLWAGSWEKGLLMVTDEETEQYMGFALGKQVPICQRQCYATQVPHLHVCSILHGQTPLEETRWKFRPSVPQNQAEAQVQAGFLYLQTNIRFYNRFAEVEKRLCEVERNTLYNKLQAISGVQNPHALMDVEATGHVIQVAGRAAYITKCVPTEVVRISHQNCTSEIPVSVNGSTRYVDPFSWILKPFPTIIQCSSVMPVRWHILGVWLCATPDAHHCTAPPKLRPTPLLKPLDSLATGLGLGLYTAQQREQHHAAVVAATSREAVQLKATHAAVSNGLAGVSLGSLLSASEVGDLKLDISTMVFPWYPLLLDAWNAIFATLIALAIVKMLSGCLIRLYILYMERGFGFWLLGAIWNTVFLVARVPSVILKAAWDNLILTRTDLNQPLPLNLHRRHRNPRPRPLPPPQEPPTEPTTRRAPSPPATPDPLYHALARSEDGRPRRIIPDRRHLHAPSDYLNLHIAPSYTTHHRSLDEELAATDDVYERRRRLQEAASHRRF